MELMQNYKRQKNEWKIEINDTLIGDFSVNALIYYTFTTIHEIRNITGTLQTNGLFKPFKAYLRTHY